MTTKETAVMCRPPYSHISTFCLITEITSPGQAQRDPAQQLRNGEPSMECTPIPDTPLIAPPPTTSEAPEAGTDLHAEADPQVWLGDDCRLLRMTVASSMRGLLARQRWALLPVMEPLQTLGPCRSDENSVTVRSQSSPCAPRSATLRSARTLRGCTCTLPWMALDPFMSACRWSSSCRQEAAVPLLPHSCGIA